MRELSRRLLYIAGLEEVKVATAPPWTDDPGRFVNELEASAEGCRWLLERWGEYRNLLDHKTLWGLAELLRFIRFQGKNVIESLYDPALNVIFLAWDVLKPGFAEQQWGYYRGSRLKTDLALNDRLSWHEIADRPADPDAAWATLYEIVNQHVERLELLLALREAAAQTDDPDWADRAALECSPAFERHRRRQSALHRELMRTLDALRKARKEEFEIQDEQGETEAEIHGEDVAAINPESAIQDRQAECPAFENAPNKPNLAAQQGYGLQGLLSGTSNLKGAEQSQCGQAAASGQPAEGSTNAAAGAAGIPESTTRNPGSEKAPNKAKSAAQQGYGSQRFKSEVVDMEGPEQTQSGGAVANDKSVFNGQRVTLQACLNSQSRC
jgi:hypothetical protein